MRSFVKAIAQEREAREELSYCAMAMVADFVLINSDVNARQLGNIYMEFGTHLLNELQRLGAYYNGFLNWKYSSMCAGDIVLVRKHHDYPIG